MPGPPPNPNARRRRSGDGFVKLEGRREGPVPELPGDGWSETTRKAWETWWASPQALMWAESDLPTLFLMAAAFEHGLAGERTALTEFRQLSDRFGLSPMARLKNRWVIEEGSETEAAAAPAEQAAGSVVPLRLRKSG